MQDEVDEKSDDAHLFQEKKGTNKGNGKYAGDEVRTRAGTKPLAPQASPFSRN